MKLIQAGPRSAKIAIVGEFPSKQDMEEGKPFSGGSAYILDKMLGRAGIYRHECFVTNVVHDRPVITGSYQPDFSAFSRKDNQTKLLLGMLQLKKDLTEVCPNVVLAMGEGALKILTNKVGIGKWRGSILPSGLIPGLKVIGSYTPQFVNQTYDYKAIVEFDMKRVKEESKSPNIHYPERHIYMPDGYVTRRSNGTDWVTTQEHYDVQAIVEEMLQAEALGTDIECYQNPNGTWSLACVGFSDRKERALVIAADSGTNMAVIRRLCESPVRKVMQNGTFDYTVLSDVGIMCENFTYDTMLAMHSLFAECAGGGDEMAVLRGKKRQSAFAKGLAFQTSIFTREPFYKDDGKLWKIDGDKNMFYRYNGLDCCVTKEIQEVQTKELSHHPGGWQMFDHSMGLVHPVIRANKRGLKVDLASRAEMKERYTSEIKRLQQVLDIFAGGPLNVKSTPEVQALLYDKLKLPKQYKKRKKADGTFEKTVTADKDALNELAAKHSNPALLTILKIRERRDLIERYLDVKLDTDGRMRSSVDLTGTRTGRLAYRASLSGSGTNLQNQPEELRQMYIADDGMVFIYSDYSQAEARVVAHYANCHGLIDLFEDPTRDIHCENAARIFGRRIPKLVQDGGDVLPEERYLAKRVVHASNYGMGPDRLVQIVNQDAETTGVRIDLATAKFLLETYFSIYPELKSIFWANVEHELAHSRTLINPFGWGRVFYGRLDNQTAKNEAYAHKPQSTVGVLCGEAWIRADRNLTPIGAEVLVNVHDALLSQVPVAKLDESIALIGEAMDIPLTINGRQFKIPVDFQVGFNWGHKGKDGSNPRGLQKVSAWKKDFAA